VRGQQQRQCLIPVKTIFVQHSFYISGETVCCNQSWVDGVDPDTLLLPISAIALAIFSKAALTDPPIVNSADPAREPIATILTMLALIERKCGRAARTILT
jgi:hypothetical protein